MSKQNSAVEKHIALLKAAAHAAKEKGNIPMAKILQRTAQFIADHSVIANEALETYAAQLISNSKE